MFALFVIELIRVLWWALETQQIVLYPLSISLLKYYAKPVINYSKEPFFWGDKLLGFDNPHAAAHAYSRNGIVVYVVTFLQQHELHCLTIVYKRNCL